MTDQLPIPRPQRKKAENPPHRPGTPFDPIIAELLITHLEAGNFECDFYELPEIAASSITPKIVERWKKGRSSFGEEVARARRHGAERLVKRGEDVLLSAEKRDEIYKARELASHYRFRASRLNPRDFGEQVNVEHSGNVELTPVSQAPTWLQQAVENRDGRTIEPDPEGEDQP